MTVWKLTGKLVKFRLKIWLAMLIIYLIFAGSILFRVYTIQLLIDKILLTGSVLILDLDLKILFILLVVFYMSEFLFCTIGDSLLIYFNSLLEYLIRKNIMNALLDKPATLALPFTSGESISRFRGDVYNVSWFTAVLSARFSMLTASFISIGIMFSINWKATIFIFIPYALMLTVSMVWRKRFEKLSKKSREATAEVTDTLGKIFDSIQTFKVTCTEKNIRNYFKSKCDNRRKAITKEQTFQAFINTIYQISVSIAMGIVLLIVGRELNLGAFTIGNLYLFQVQLFWMGDFIWSIGSIVASYQQSKVSFNRILALMQNHENSFELNDIVAHGSIYIRSNYDPLITLNRKDIEQLVSLTTKNLSFRYPGTDKGIQDVTLSIPKGSITIITGRIGSGKTTLIRTLLGLLPKDSGQIYWNNKEIQVATNFMIPPKVAYTPQVPYLFSESLKDNILLNLREDTVDIEKAIKLAVFDDEIKAFNDKLETIIGPKGVRLSGGQKQRLAAARMFVRKPELLVFDDLSSALDVETEQKLWNRLYSKSQDITCLAVSHRPIAFQKADNIIVMKNGKILAQGTLDELLDTNEEMQKLWEGDIISNDIKIKTGDIVEEVKTK